MNRPLITTLLHSLVPLGGVESVRLRLDRYFVQAGFGVDLLLVDERNDVAAIVPEGVRVINLNARRLRSSIRPLVRYLKEEKPDAFQASMWPLTSIGILAHRLAGSKARMIVSDHNMLSIQYSGSGFLHRLALKASIAASYPRADACIGPSRGVVDDVARLAGLPRACFEVIHNPLALALDQTPDTGVAEAAWGGWEGPRILSVGRFKSQKNHALLIRSFKRLLAVRDARLMIVGTGQLLDETRAVASVEGIADKVLTPGDVTDPRPYYQAADLFVLSSDYEGFCNVIVEALAFGLPVVSTNCPSGPSDVLDNGRYGRLVPVGDAGALAKSMVEALDTEHDHDALRRRASCFGVERIGEQYLRLAKLQNAAGLACGNV